MHLNPFTAAHPAGPLAPGHVNPLLGGYVFAPRPGAPFLGAGAGGDSSAVIAARVFGPKGGGGSLMDGDKGDITVSSSGTVWNIDAGVVTYAKFQDASASNVMLARVTAAAGDYEELAIAANTFPARASTGQLAAKAITDLGLSWAATATVATHLVTLGITNAPKSYVHLRDEKTSGTAGGTFTSGAWQTRVLNTKSSDDAAVCTLSSNQFTLTAGTYTIRARAPGVLCDEHQARLQNITDGTTTIQGGSGYGTSTTPFGATDVWVLGRFTIAGTKTFELQHRCTTTRATNGFGIACSFGGGEVYAEVELWKE